MEFVIDILTFFTVVIGAYLVIQNQRQTADAILHSMSQNNNLSMLEIIEKDSEKRITLVHPRITHPIMKNLTLEAATKRVEFFSSLNLYLKMYNEYKLPIKALGKMKLETWERKGTHRFNKMSTEDKSLLREVLKYHEGWPADFIVWLNEKVLKSDCMDSKELILYKELHKKNKKEKRKNFIIFVIIIAVFISMIWYFVGKNKDKGGSKVNIHYESYVPYIRCQDRLTI